MDLLAFDTSTDQTTIAVQRGDALWQWQGGGGPQASGTLIPKILEGLSALSLTPQALTAIVFGQGPGAFTGLRTACAVAQGLAFGSQVPVLPVCSLLAVAHTAYQTHGCANVLAVLDARMGEVYAAAFVRTADGLALAGQEQVLAPQAVAVDGQGWYGVGTGLAAADAALVQHLGPALSGVDAAALPHAADLASLAVAAWARGEAIAPERVEPAYLRNNVALTIAEQQALREARA